MVYQRGLSLVELMIAITLGLILMTGVTQLFISSKETYQTQQASSRVQETGRLAVELLGRDIRMAGFTAFRGRSVGVDNKLPSPTYVKDFRNGLSVYTASSSEGTDVGALANTNVLVIRGALDGEASALKQPPEEGVFTVASRSTKLNACASGGTSFNGLCIEDDLIIADASKVVVFRPTALSVNGGDLEIEYDGTWGESYIDVNNYFDRGAQIAAAKTKTYFIRKGASGQPSLFVRENNDAAQELLEGVSNIAVRYNRRGSAGTYENAAGKLDGIWGSANSIVSVQLELLVTSLEDNVVDEKQVYTFNGTDVTATDKRFNQVFSTTIAVRNLLQ